eukprot:13222153-Alexandrium_andersonii.AAC.1
MAEFGHFRMSEKNISEDAVAAIKKGDERTSGTDTPASAGGDGAGAFYNSNRKKTDTEKLLSTPSVKVGADEVTARLNTYKAKGAIRGRSQGRES